jgi:hypothetical protein
MYAGPLTIFPTSVRMDIIPEAAWQEESKRFGRFDLFYKNLEGD